MSNSGFLLLISIVLFFGAERASAQEQQEGPSLLKTGVLGMGAEFGACNKGPMLDSPAVRKELKLTPAQIARLQQAKVEGERISRRIGEDSRRLLRQYTAEGDREGLAGVEQAQWKMALSLTREDERPLLNVLDKQQVSRLEQLQLRADGPWAFMRPEVQNRLRMSPEQVELVQALFEQGARRLRNRQDSRSAPSGSTPECRPNRNGNCSNPRISATRWTMFGSRSQRRATPRSARSVMS